MPMTERIIDLSSEPAYLHINNNQLIIEKESGNVSVPVKEIACIIASHPQLKYSNAVISRLCSSGGIFIVCDEKRMPAGMMLPIDSHYIQTLRFDAQINLSLPLRKQIWKQIVKHKIDAQSQVLLYYNNEDGGLRNLMTKVRSGDPNNIEAHTAKRYWRQLFGDEFRRDHNAGTGINAMLNYGYGILRSFTARAICGAGMHPSIGVHHHNQYNSFCLVDDIMEPYRPVVDAAVYESRQMGLMDNDNLSKENKMHIISHLLQKRCKFDKFSRDLADSIKITAFSLVDILMGKKKKIIYPKLY